MKKQPTSLISPVYLKLWWFPFMVGMIVIVGTMAVLVPQTKGIIATNAKLKRVTTDVSKAEKKLLQVNALNEDEMAWRMKLLTQALPSDKPYYQVIGLLQQLGIQTGVVLGEFELSPGSLATPSAQKTKTAKEDYVTLDTELAISGTTDQVSDFIVRLHESLPLLKITDVSISSDEVAQDDDVRRAQLTLQIVYLTDPEIQKEVSLEPIASLSTETVLIENTLRGYFNPEALIATQSASVSNFSRTDLFNY